VTEEIPGNANKEGVVSRTPKKFLSPSVVVFSVFAIAFVFLFSYFSGSNRNADTGSSYTVSGAGKSNLHGYSNKNLPEAQGNNPLYFDNEIVRKVRTVHHAENGAELIEPKPPFGYSSIRVKNRRKRDVVFQIQDAHTGEVKREIYLHGSYSKVIHQIPPGTFILSFVSGVGWDNVANTFEKASPREYIGDYHVFMEEKTSYAYVVTNKIIAIPPSANPEEDKEEREIFYGKARPSVPKEDYEEVRKWIEKETNRKL